MSYQGSFMHCWGWNPGPPAGLCSHAMASTLDQQIRYCKGDSSTQCSLAFLAAAHSHGDEGVDVLWGMKLPPPGELHWSWGQESR